MSRPLRIQYPDAWYHVMNRARRGQDLFLDNADRDTFLSLLKETAAMFNPKVSVIEWQSMIVGFLASRF
jgi:putative transposase